MTECMSTVCAHVHFVLFSVIPALIVSTRFVSGEPWSSSSCLSRTSPFSLPLPHSQWFFSFSAHYPLSCDSLKSESIYSFIQPFSGKIFESLITSDSSPPFIFALLLKSFWSSKHFLVYISTLTHLLSATGRFFFPLMKKRSIWFFFKRTFRYVSFS